MERIYATQHAGKDVVGPPTIRFNSLGMASGVVVDGELQPLTEESVIYAKSQPGEFVVLSSKAGGGQVSGPGQQEAAAPAVLVAVAEEPLVEPAIEEPVLAAEPQEEEAKKNEAEGGVENELESEQ